MCSAVRRPVRSEARVCPSCGKAKAFHALTCRQCHLEQIAQPLTQLTCAHCAGSFQLDKAEADKRQRRYSAVYCSRSCARAARSQPKDRGSCVCCGKALTTREQKVYCSRECYNTKRRGPQYSPQYQGEFLHLRNVVADRDGRTCAMMGSSRALEIHHVDHDPSNNDLSNLITLSKTAHALYHSMPDAQQAFWRRMFSELIASRTSS